MSVDERAYKDKQTQIANQYKLDQQELKDKY